MKQSPFLEEQIIGILKEHQAGLSAAEICRKHGISDAPDIPANSRSRTYLNNVPSACSNYEKVSKEVASLP